jgi:NAD(P)-dependent dehydrogenase (short-subunit alcohol dehydrogenase family)
VTALPVVDGAMPLTADADQMMVEDIADLSEDQWVHTFNTNIHPFFYVSKYALAHMKPGATIINNASINAYIGRPDLLDYTSTKGAIVSFTRGLSNQCLAKGIRVNAVAPGPGESLPFLPFRRQSRADSLTWSGCSLDPAHPGHDERPSAKGVYEPHGQTCAAV